MRTEFDLMSQKMVNFDEMKRNDKHTSFKDPRLFWKFHFLTKRKQ